LLAVDITNAYLPFLSQQSGPDPDEEPDEYAEFLDDEEAWYDKQEKDWPEGKEHYDGGLDSVQKSVGLRDMKLQVIVKLANIVLNPNKPTYAGGKWHVEGTMFACGDP
jgi:hypothetical protein